MFNTKSELLINFVSLIMFSLFSIRIIFKMISNSKLMKVRFLIIGSIYRTFIQITVIRYISRIWPDSIHRLSTELIGYHLYDKKVDGIFSTGKANIINKYDQLKSQPTFLLEDLSLQNDYRQFVNIFFNINIFILPIKMCE